MNEHLKQLTKQAGIKLSPACRPAQFSGVLESEVSEFDLEKFAELIAKECEDICTGLSESYYNLRKNSTDDYYDKIIYSEGQAAAEAIRYRINKKFGVQA